MQAVVIITNTSSIVAATGIAPTYMQRRTAPLFSFFISPVAAQFSRKHEFEADAYAVSQTDAGAKAVIRE